MSADSLSDDSAVGSTNSSATNQDTQARPPATQPLPAPPSQSEQQQSQARPRLTRPSAKDLLVNSDDLRLAGLRMRNDNVYLISRSCRTVFACFDDLELRAFEPKNDYLINFISSGAKKCSDSTPRTASILWPDNYEKTVDQLSILDAYLLNTGFRERPADWMLERGLTIVPSCRICKDKMKLTNQSNIVRWQCQKTHACTNFTMPVQRPSFFRNFENVGLDKLLFSVYYWSICVPSYDLYSQLQMAPKVLDAIWRRIQNVCRAALEKSYPRFRLTNVVDQGTQSNDLPEPIDLISIKLKTLFIVCAKHPHSNLVRLGLYIPKVSQYSFAELTETWFAHGAQIRTSEIKFMELSKRRTDLKIQMASRIEMMTKYGSFDRNSAFGYIICQLAQSFKDFDSSTCSRAHIKQLLAEMQWRELYGTTAFDAFTNIVNHMALYGEASNTYLEPALSEIEPTPNENLANESLVGSEYVWTEVYFYATNDPLDSRGYVISRYVEPQNLAEPPPSDVRIKCHECGMPFESFDFSFHMIEHVETIRKVDQKKEYLTKGVIECKHCFKMLKRDDVKMHAAIFRSHYQTIKYGCRICCTNLEDRNRYLQHMRTHHFEHETPYRCPSCKFSSSFQRDVFIHFQEEHRHSMIVLCPLCLRSFTILFPESMTAEKMTELSRVFYNHIAEHYAISNKFTCSNCCLCFLSKDQLRSHKLLHHNPLEIRLSKDVKLVPFEVEPQEEKYCVKALQLELFVANKRPNLIHDQTNGGESSEDDDSEEDEDSSPDSSSALDDDDNESHHSDVIHVRGLSEAEKFLKVSTGKADDSRGSALTSEMLVMGCKWLKRADGIIPNQSAILGPDGSRVKCLECSQFVTVDHFVARIKCKQCKHSTLCPRAATNHIEARHQTS